MMAPRRGWPTRAIALLIADPSPENRCGIEPMSVLVSGATTQAMPRPNVRTAGNTSVRYPIDGTSDAGRSRLGVQAGEVAGSRVNHSRAAAMSVGPRVRNVLAPTRPTIVPIRGESV